MFIWYESYVQLISAAVEAIDMLVKVEDGFYLNSQHIIAVRIRKNAIHGNFSVVIEYTPNNVQGTGIYQKNFDNGVEAESYLFTLNKAIG